MQLLWLNDIHLNFLLGDSVAQFLQHIADLDPAGLLIGGDIGESDTCVGFLERMAETLDRPIYFILGNHDYYRGSLAGVNGQIESLCRRVKNLHWVTGEPIVRLTDRTALIGHESWCDGRSGDYAGSRLVLTDFRLIEEFSGLDRDGRLAMLNKLGDRAAEHFARVLPAALEQADRVIALVHVPPFPQAALHEGRMPGPHWLPYLVCQAVGDVLLDIMQRNPAKELLVLCGHTHGTGEVRILDNLRLLTGRAKYGEAIKQVQTAGECKRIIGVE
jgi:3',5'-cyclic AMP phosphodiesterase CpdA